MGQLQAIYGEGCNWLMEHPLETWARHKFDPRAKCDFVTNNHVESFNSWLGNTRQKPITGILESIAKKLMSKFGKRFQRTVEWTNTIVPKARNKLNSNISKVATCELIWPGGNLYQITQMDTHMSYIVNLGERSCCCGEWQVSGVPCRHACAAIAHTRHDFESFCSDFYSKSTYAKTYSTFIHPLHHDTMWTEVDKAPLEPPILKRPIGRPRVKRKREVGEPKATRKFSVITCSICGVFGHNKRGCEKAPIAAQVKAANAKAAATAAGPSSSTAPKVRRRKSVPRRSRRIGVATQGSQGSRSMAAETATTTPTTQDTQGSRNRATKTVAAPPTAQGSQGSRNRATETVAAPPTAQGTQGSTSIYMEPARATQGI